MAKKRREASHEIDLDDIILGEEFDTKTPLFAGVCDEPIRATVLDFDPGKYVLFNLTYFGVFIGEACVEKVKGKQEWTDL